VSAVFGLFSLILAGCGVAIAAAGIKAATDGHGAAPGSILIVIGVVVLYPAYFFARTAWGARRAAGSETSVRQRHASVLRFFFLYVLAGIALAFVLPVSGLAKVTLIVMVVAGAGVGMAARVDPERPQVKRGRRHSSS
jgi:hypothetical protein